MYLDSPKWNEQAENPNDIENVEENFVLESDHDTI